MTLRHTASLEFSRQNLDDWGLSKLLGLRDQGNNGCRVQPHESHEPDSTACLAGMRVFGQLVSSFKSASAESADSIAVQLDAGDCDALVSLMVSLPRDSEAASARTQKLNGAIDHVRSTREALSRTAEAWRDADAMYQESIRLNLYERLEITHWIDNSEDPIEIGQWDGISLREWQGHVRLRDIVNNSSFLASITGDLAVFLALRYIMADGQDVALEWDYLGHQGAELRYRDLMGKIDDAICSLEMLESDARLRPKT